MLPFEIYGNGNRYGVHLFEDNDDMNRNVINVTSPQPPMSLDTAQSHPKTHVTSNIPRCPTCPPSPSIRNNQQNTHLSGNWSSEQPGEKRTVPGTRLYSQAHKPVFDSNGPGQNLQSSRNTNGCLVTENTPRERDTDTNKWLRPCTDKNPPSECRNRKLSAKAPPTTTNKIKPAKILVASSSLTKSIEFERFKNCLPAQGSVRFQRWHGARARHIKHYIGPHVIEEKPNAVLIQAGGNDLAEFNSDINTVANDIIEIGIVAKKMGAKDIFIGGVPVRSRQYSNQKLNELNFALQSRCQEQNFIFIANTDLTVQHLSDGVHLNNMGTKILANNYLDALREYYDWPIRS